MHISISSSLQVLKILPSKAEFNHKGGKYFCFYFTGGQINKYMGEFPELCKYNRRGFGKNKEIIWMNWNRTVFLYRYLKCSLLHVPLQKKTNTMFERKDGEM